jgi:hypothetical protein
MMPLVDPLLHVVATGFAIIVLARAVIDKALNFSGYLATLRGYRLLPSLAAPAAAMALLAAEALAIVLLLVPATAFIGGGLAAALFALYAAAMAIVLTAGRTEIECGCGGKGQIVTWGLVARNAVLVATAAFIWLPTVARTLALSDMLMGLAAILVSLLLLATAEKAIGTSVAIKRLTSQFTP